jgi:hypothetical protein
LAALPPASEELRALIARRRQNSQHGPHRFSKVSQDFGIDLVGLGPIDTLVLAAMVFR